MQYVMLKSKIHKATVTGAELDYEGSMTIDSDIMSMAGIRPHEKILVANLVNGERLETYAIPGEPGAKEFCLIGAAAHKGKTGDRVIIMSFCLVDESEISSHRPRMVILDENNKPV